LILLVLPQGRDTLLLVVEKMDGGDYRQLLFFLFALTIWSMMAEFSVRYSISISDNSGKSLRDSRVYARKIAQRFLAAFCLFSPGIFILIALVFTYLSADYMKASAKNFNFAIFGVLLYGIFRALSYLYFYRLPRQDNQSARTYLGARSLPAAEYDWVNRLYGIYNEFVFEFPKASNFIGEYANTLKTFTDYFTACNSPTRDIFPKNNKVMNKRRIIPALFNLQNKGQITTGRGDSYKWRYAIPNSYFPVLHRQLKIVFFPALIIFFTFSFMPARGNAFGVVGAPALLAFAFACYSGIYSGLLFLDYAWLRKSFISFRLALILLVVLFSYINQDHPVDQAFARNARRPAAVDQFNHWFRQYKKDMDEADLNNEKTNIKPDSTFKKYPVVFICAEGGAFRTGAYTSIYLARLQKEMQKDNFNFKRSIFSMSGVSGGALGLAYYNAKAFGSASNDIAAGSDTSKAKVFFKHDSLSPIVGKMLFGEFLNLFLPWHVKLFDRAIALEQSWQSAFDGVRSKNEDNRFDNDFLAPKTDTLQPMLIINTTEIESGYQCWISNYTPDSIAYLQKRDLLANKLGHISYSTAVNFSTRFPLFSPGAKIDTSCGRFHYLDGGYVENTGAGSTFELLNLLEKKSPYFKFICPIILYLRFGDDTNTGVYNIRFANEGFEVLSGIYNTRVGRSRTAVYQLNQFINQRGGLIIDQPLLKNQRQVPMNWMLSDQSIANIDSDLALKFHPDSPQTFKNKLATRKIKLLKINP